MISKAVYVRRFFQKVTVSESGCWEWTGAKYRNGYGAFAGPGRKTTCAHRIGYELLVGAIPDGLTLDHLCRNRACVNPDHLEPVTHRENCIRGRALRTHCPQGHPYDETNTYVKQTPRGTSRECRTCHRDVERARRRRTSTRPSQASTG